MSLHFSDDEIADYHSFTQEYMATPLQADKNAIWGKYQQLKDELVGRAYSAGILERVAEEGVNNSPRILIGQFGQTSVSVFNGSNFGTKLVDPDAMLFTLAREDGMEISFFSSKKRKGLFTGFDIGAYYGKRPDLLAMIDEVDEIVNSKYKPAPAPMFKAATGVDSKGHAFV